MKMRLAVSLCLLLNVACQCPVCNQTNQTNVWETFASFSVTDSFYCPLHSSTPYAGAISDANCTCDVGFLSQDNVCSEQAVSSALDIALWSGVAAGVASLLGGGGLVSMGAFQAATVVPPNMFTGVRITL